MVLATLSNNSKLLFENMFTWAIYAAAVATAVMPILQALAFMAAFAVSMLTAVKILKEFFTAKKDKNASNNKKG